MIFSLALCKRMWLFFVTLQQTFSFFFFSCSTKPVWLKLWLTKPSQQNCKQKIANFTFPPKKNTQKLFRCLQRIAKHFFFRFGNRFGFVSLFFSVLRKINCKSKRKKKKSSLGCDARAQFPGTLRASDFRDWPERNFFGLLCDGSLSFQFNLDGVMTWNSFRADREMSRNYFFVSWAPEALA